MRYIHTVNTRKGMWKIRMGVKIFIINQKSGIYLHGENIIYCSMPGESKLFGDEMRLQKKNYLFKKINYDLYHLKRVFMSASIGALGECINYEL